MSDTAPPPPEAVLTQMIFGKWIAMALSVAAKLRLADALASGPKSVTRIVPTKAPTSVIEGEVA
jgi:hypothetical protein